MKKRVVKIDLTRKNKNVSPKHHVAKQVRKTKAKHSKAVKLLTSKTKVNRSIARKTKRTNCIIKRK